MDDSGNKKWADRFKSKKPKLTDDQIEAKNKRAIADLTVIKGELHEQRPQKPQGPAPTPPEKSTTQKPEGSAPTLSQKFTGDYASADEIMKAADAQWQAENRDIKSKGSDSKESPPKDKTEYVPIPDVLTMKLYQATNSEDKANLLENQLDKVTKQMEAITIKTAEGMKIDSFKPSLDIIRDQLFMSTEKTEKFGKAMESAAKEPDLAKQDKIIKDAVKDVVQGHKTDLVKQMEKANEGLASSILKDAKYTSPRDLPDAKARPTDKNTSHSR